MKHTIKSYAGDILGTIDIDDTRAAEIAQAKEDTRSQEGAWHFLAGDWLTDEEIEKLKTSHECEVQIISIDRPGFILHTGGSIGNGKTEGGDQ